MCASGPHNPSRGPAQGGEDRDRVREASDIVQVVGEHLTLRAKGREFVGVCPFHDDHKPSMYVVPDKQIFHCFSCGAGGDVFTFVQKYHAMDFPEALKFLAERAGIELRPRRRGEGGGASSDEGGVSRADLAEACAYAQAFFGKVLRDPALGASARAVAERRGLAGEIGERFGIGASPDRWDGLLSSIQKKGLSLEPFIAAGLLKRREQGDGCYDALRNRLIFPIRDQLGRTVAFGGRRINDEDEPKYLNSPESPLFNKSATLFGLDLAARSLSKQKHDKRFIVVEGYTDAIACHRAGFDTAIATLGTALTPDHARLLRRYHDASVVLLFDGDEAGQRAADRAVEVFFAEPIDVRVATLTPDLGAKDPDELLALPDGRARFSALLDGAEDVLAWRFAQFRAELESRGVHGRATLVERYLTRLHELGLGTLDPIRRKFVLEQLASITGLGWAELTRLAPAGRRPGRGGDPRAGEARTVESKPRAASRLTPGGGVLAAVLAFPELASALRPSDLAALQDAMDEDPSNAPLAGTAAAAVELIARGQRPELASVLGRVDAGDAGAATAAAREVGLACDQDPARGRVFLEDCLARLRQWGEARASGDSADDPLARLAALRARGGVGRPAAYPRTGGDGRA